MLPRNVRVKVSRPSAPLRILDVARREVDAGPTPRARNDADASAAVLPPVYVVTVALHVLSALTEKDTTNPSPVPGMIPISVPDLPSALSCAAMGSLPSEPKKICGPRAAT